MNKGRNIAVGIMLRRETANMTKTHETPLFAAMLMLSCASENWKKLDYGKMLDEALAESGVTLLDWCRVLEDVLERHAVR